MPDQAKPRFDVPSGACDCHVHIFDPEHFPYSPERSYTPGTASVDDLLAFESRIGMSRFVLVQPSPYGSDNACLLAALKHLGDKARGVAVIDPDRTPDSELDALAQAGVRSVRVNLEAHGNRDPRAAERALDAVSRRIAGRGWSIQVFASLPVVAELKDEVLRLPVPLVVDHFGGARAEAGTDQPGFATLIEMLKSGKVYLKLSAPYRRVARSGLRRRGEDRPSVHRRGSGADGVGVRLAAHGRGCDRVQRAPGPQPLGHRAVPAGRRAEGPRAPRGVVRRRADVAPHPRRQSGTALRLPVSPPDRPKQTRTNRDS